jgi:glycosyltransferase involved in cell wall biosynthesis
MKIAIDVSPVVYETGVSVYTRNLVKNLLEIDNKNKYLLFAGTLRRKKDIEIFFSSLKGSFETKIIPISPMMGDLFWNILHKVKIEKLLGDIDVFHSSDWTQPPTDAFKVTTIHDLVPFKFPRLAHPRIRKVHKRRLEHVKNEADAVIVPSQTTKEDVCTLGINKERIFVIPEAADETFGNASETKIAGVKRKYRIHGKYILAVGVNPRKNTQRIIDAYSTVKSKYKVKLVIIGLHSNKVEHKRGVIYTGHVHSDEVAALYQGAEVLVYPSLYEGFGLPILEAFASEIPVVTSNISSMSEVAGNAAVLVDPYEIESIEEGIKMALKRKITYIRKGVKRLKLYSWKITAENTLKVYNKASI